MHRMNLRVLVEPIHLKDAQVAFKDLAIAQRSGRIKIMHEEVELITNKAVKPRGGEWARYDKLVLAMGSDYADHIKPDTALTLPARSAQIHAMHQSLQAAQRIQIFGAGLVGVELAAEVAESFPNKHVTLRSRSAVLLPGFPAKAQTYVLQWFK